MTSITDFTRKTALAALAGVSTLALALSAQAQDAVDLAGETVEFVIPFSESGGSARWANFYAPLLSEALPGNPTVVVKFMPGAGSTKGANWFQDQSADDGTVIFGTSGSTQFPYLLGDPRVRYEYNDWQVVLASGVGGVTYLPPDVAERFDGDADDLGDIDFLWGSQGATRLDLVANLAWKMLGMKVEPVFGIEGRGDGRLMFERGEANIDYQTSPAYLKSVVPMVEEGLAVPMMTWGGLDDAGEIIRDPNFRTSRPSRRSARRPPPARPAARPGMPGKPFSSPASRRRRWFSFPAALPPNWWLPMRRLSTRSSPAMISLRSRRKPSASIRR